jgi:aminoglycoside phosphotransferase (APT) family kinase protein
MQSSDESIINGLNRLLLRDILPGGPAEVAEVVQITDGWENEVYTFSTQPSGEGPAYILRIYPGDGAAEKAMREYQALEKLHRARYPAPQVFALGTTDSPFGQPFVIMEKIEGESLGRAARNASEGDRKRYLSSFCETFVQLHRLDWKAIASEPLPYNEGDPFGFIHQEIVNSKAFVAGFGLDTLPGAPELLRWMEARQSDVPCSRLSVTHGDYHPNNVLLRPDGSPCVIDWPNVDVGDYRMDLAWTLLLTSTYRNPEMRSLLLSEYERGAGRAVERIEYFEVLASARRLYGIYISLKSGPERLGMRPESALLMREQADHIQNVYRWHIERTGIPLPEIEEMIAELV